MADDTPITAPDGTVLFSKAELACKGSGGLRLSPGFARHLRDLRLAFGKPMSVNSCCRSAAYNAEIGGHPRSLHVHDEPHHPSGGAAAIDIATPNNRDRAQLIALALERGWSVGVYGSFVHLDRRIDVIPGKRAPEVFHGGY